MKSFVLMHRSPSIADQIILQDERAGLPSLYNDAKSRSAKFCGRHTKFHDADDSEDEEEAPAKEENDEEQASEPMQVSEETKAEIDSLAASMEKKL